MSNMQSFLTDQHKNIVKRTVYDLGLCYSQNIIFYR